MRGVAGRGVFARVRLVALIGVAALVAASCSGDDTSSGSRDDAPPSPETETLFTTDGEEVEVEVVPADLLAVVRDGVEEDRWTEAEGIALALDGITDRQDVDPALEPAAPRTAGITALVRRARDLIEAGDISAEDRESLSDVLAYMTPTQEALDAISEPADGERPGSDALGTSGGRVTRGMHTRPDGVRGEGGRGVFGLRELVLGCQQGFSEDVDAGDGCYVYEEESVGGDRLRVYYPDDWFADDADHDRNSAVIDATMEALVRSTETYAAFSTVGDVNAVLSVHESEGTLAAQLPFDAGDACPVSVYQAGDVIPNEQYKQVVAHEVFHCVQEETFSIEFPYSAHDWWVEGSAEFFSNVAYPEVDLEHLYTSDFDRKSLNSPLDDMSYENTVFFQYVANRSGGPPAVIEMLHTVSDAGGSVDALTSIGDIEDLWQDFVVAFVADAITDTSGEGTVGRGRYVTRKPPISDVASVDLEAEPFVAKRYGLVYEKAKRFVQEADADPLHAMVPDEEKLDLEAWTEALPEIRTKCRESERYVYVTTTVDGNATSSVDVDEVNDAECDPCLLGAWDMDLGSFKAYMDSVFASIGGGGGTFEFDIRGNYYASFDDEGRVRLVRRDLTVIPLVQGGQSFSTTIDGEDGGDYSTDGETLTVTGLSGSASASGRVGALEVPVGPFASEGPGSGSASYTCDEDQLTIAESGRAEVSFDRIDEIPEPEDVDVETGE